MKYKLVCFDVDGTLIDNMASSWQIFHDFFGIDKEIRQKAMDQFHNKEITYEEWAEHDIDLWKKAGKKKKDFELAINESNLCLMPGAIETLKTLRSRCKLAIISGSINILLEQFLPNFKNIFDDIYISNIHFDRQGNILGINPTAYDMEGKAIALQHIASREKINLKDCAFIGDNHNDCFIAKEVGLSIAFNAKDEKLKKCCDICIDKKDLREILPYLISRTA